MSISLHIFLDCKTRILEKDKNINNSLYITQQTLEIIQKITQQITSPTYKKTPYFEKRTNRNTRYVKKIKIPSILEIRSILNKISYQNYQKLQKQFFDIIEQMKEDEDFLKNIFDCFFDIVSINKCMIDIYIDLHNDILHFFKSYLFIHVYEESFNEFIKDYLDSFDKIQVVNPNENYDLFCSESKLNEKRKTRSTFLIKLGLFSVVHLQNIYDFFVNLLNNIEDFEIFNEIVDNIFIFISISCNNKKDYKYSNEMTDQSICIVNNIEKIKDSGKISNRGKFKCMDLLDLWKKTEKENTLST